MAVVLTSAHHAAQKSNAMRVSRELGVSLRTLERWRRWWREQFVGTPLWRAERARFMPPLDEQVIPCELLVRFLGTEPERMLRVLIFLSPLTCRAPIKLREGC